jgi:hypothetical protein
MKISLDIKGDRELIAKLQKIQGTPRGAQVTELFYNAAAMVSARAAMLAPFGTTKPWGNPQHKLGALKRSIKPVRTRRSLPEAFVTSFDRGGQEATGSTLAKKPGRRRKVKKKQWYAVFVERGHKAGKRIGLEALGVRRHRKRTASEKAKLALLNAKRTVIPPKPFMKPALDQSRNQILQMLRTGINQIVANVT